MPSFLVSIQRFFRLPDLRRKFFTVVGLIVAARLIASIPIPGVDRTQLNNIFNSGDTAFSLLNIFSSGGLINFSMALMGVGPYVTSSIIFQLLTMVIPSLEALQKEGEYGRKKINQYTRLCTIPLAFIQGFSTLTYLKSQNIITQWTPWNLIFMLVIATAGTMLLVWIGELISEQGIGNGMSMIITVGILSSFPTSVHNAWLRYSGSGVTVQDYLQLLGFVVLAAVSLAAIIFMNEGVRKIPISYARQVRGNKTYGGADSTLPVKVNASGVVPIIFAVSMVMFPTVIAKFLEAAQSPHIRAFGTALSNFFANQLYYGIIYFALVIGFTYFYTFIILQPNQMAETLQKQGCFIPGVRPGADTEKFLYSIINRITFAGAIFLGLIAVLPIATQAATKVQTLTLGGTSLLIAVAVILEIMRQVRAQIKTRTYDTYI